MAVVGSELRYSLNRRQTVERGIGIIISQSGFNSHRTRTKMPALNEDGMEEYRRKAEQVLTSMGINRIERRSNLRTAELSAFLRTQAVVANQAQSSMVVIFMRSRGRSDGALATADGYVEPFSDILSIFDEIRTYANLIGKPKIVFCDADYGELIDHIGQGQGNARASRRNRNNTNGGAYADFWRLDPETEENGGRVQGDRDVRGGDNNMAKAKQEGTKQNPLPPALVDSFVYRAAVPGHMQKGYPEMSSQLMESLAITFTDTKNRTKSLLDLFLITQRHMSERYMEFPGTRGRPNLKLCAVGSLLTTMTKELYPCRLRPLAANPNIPIP